MMKKEEDVNFVHSLYSQSNEKPSLQVDFLFGFITVFVIIGIIWANLAQIDELARGEGKVVPSDKIQTIQSLDGGIVEEILVRTGGHVTKGLPLMKIDITRFQASLEENKESYNQWLVMRERLELESTLNLQQVPKFSLSSEIKELGAEYVKSEEALYNSRIGELQSAIKVLDSQRKQKVQELKEVKEQIKQLKVKVKLVQVERTTVKKLVQTGIKSKVELIAVEKEYQQYVGDIKTAELSIPRLEFAITEIKDKKQEQLQKFQAEASKELQQISVEIKKAEARLVSETDKLDKTVIKSPVDGIIKEIYMNTIGGVVQSGDTLMDIIPNSDNLIVEAKIDPKDIAFINPMQKAIVKISAYDFTIYGGLDGKIINISADSIIDKDSKEGKSFYKVTIQTEKNFLEKNGVKLPIIPGMVTNVDIITGKKTIMDYILKPILKIKQNAFHEK